jgi:beta-glucosidase/6-phospho-beta-glucosidase/beta-galactosidase
MRPHPGMLLLAFITAAACSDDGTVPLTTLAFPPIGSLSTPSGATSFRFGVATAATQIEDNDTSTDWYLWTSHSQGGLGMDTFVGDAVMGYTDALPDITLLQHLGVDSYRFSMEWARIEPQKGHIDESALQHYSDILDALHAAHIRPLVTIHHFSNPVWIDDPRDPTCASGPSDTNLCGLGDPVGGPLVVQAFADHAELLAQRFGDRVDEWGTINEPINYLLAAYGVGQFPPGKHLVLSQADLLGKFVPVVRDYLQAHVAMYRAIKQYDTTDADGDGVAASVGMSLATIEWVAAAANEPSMQPVDVEAQQRVTYVFNHLWVDALEKGAFDPTLDETWTEPQPTWQGAIDWLGVQYYARMGVTGHSPLFPPPVSLTPCEPPLDLGSCLPPLDPTFCVPIMNYEYDPQGLYVILDDLGHRWPNVPLVVTEAGIATDVGDRRAENVVRTLEQIVRAQGDGVDVRGYYHWSLMDNFEWQLGFAPHFGLYHVDRTTFDRTPTSGADVFSQITASRTVTEALRSQWGGTGPLTPEPNAPAGPLCTP